MISARFLGRKTAIAAITFALGVNGAAQAASPPSVHHGSSAAGIPAVAGSHTFTVLHNFSGTDGSTPVGNLDLAIGPGFRTTLYGETQGGGTGSSGTIFSYGLQSNVFTSLYSFTGVNDGGFPAGGLATNETAYFPAGQTQLGVALDGGADGQGTLFSVAPNGAPTVVHTFTGGTDGAIPTGRLTLFTDGNYYGTTASGALGYGTVYRVTPAGQFSTIYSFTGGADGGSPAAGLALRVSFFGAANSALSPAIERTATSSRRYVSPYLYGTTSSGGANNAGTIFAITPTGKPQTLYSFTGGSDGGSPAAKLLSDLRGNLYGSTMAGGSQGNGVIFEIPAGSTTPKVIHDFGNGATGAVPLAQITLGFDGNLYGTASQGGAGGNGDVFEISRWGAFSDIHDFAGTDGSAPEGALVDGGDGNLYGTASSGGTTFNGVLFAISERSR
jgi:uncharacterized repeat protein (TIGR03803 family)